MGARFEPVTIDPKTTVELGDHLIYEYQVSPILQLTDRAIFDAAAKGLNFWDAPANALAEFLTEGEPLIEKLKLDIHRNIERPGLLTVLGSVYLPATGKYRVHVRVKTAATPIIAYVAGITLMSLFLTIVGRTVSGWLRLRAIQKLVTDPDTPQSVKEQLASDLADIARRESEGDPLSKLTGRIGSAVSVVIILVGVLFAAQFVLPLAKKTV